MDAARVQVYNLIDQVQQVPTQLLLAVACLSILSFGILVLIRPMQADHTKFILT
jgi:dolichyl-phosphate beta-glucosyltransferase